MSKDFTEAVLVRPKMYTLMGTYPEVIAFLEGYYSGLAKGQSGMSEVVHWSSFRQWLAQKLEVSAENELEVLASSYEAGALTAFDCLYQEFKTHG